MKPLWADTDADTEAEMIRLLHSASVARRFELVQALTSSVISLSRRALARSRPEVSELEVLLEWVGIHYSKETELEVRGYLRGRGLG